MSEQERNRTSVPGFIRSILAIPLTGKIAGANAVIGIAAIVAFTFVAKSGSDAGDMLHLFVIALVVALVANLILVRVALQPLKSIEDTVRHVVSGNLDARVPESILADSNVERVGQTLNLLLEVLSRDQNRIRKLTGRVITAGDTERAAMSR